MLEMDADQVLQANGVVPSTPDADAVDIGREFVRQYYMLLSEKPNEVHRFYSHQSIFMREPEIQFVGQANIQQILAKNPYETIKVRIINIIGSHTLGNGIVINVLGMLMAHDLGSEEVWEKPFNQTFVLCQQSPKKFFVQNDICYFLEEYLKNENAENLKFGKVIEATTPQPNVANKENQAPAQAPKVNGHHHPQQNSAEKAAPEPKEKKETPPKEKKEHKHKQEKKEHKDHKEKEHNSKEAHHKNEKKNAVVNDPTPPEPVAVKEEPKTWAKMAASGAKAQPAITSETVHISKSSTATVTTIPVPKEKAAAAPAPHQNGVKKDGPHHHDKFDGERKYAGQGARIYIGGIQRNIIPDVSEEPVVHQQIIAALSHLGEALSVYVPRKCYDKSQDTRNAGAFAFVALKTKEDADKIFKAASKDEGRGIYTLPLVIPAFDFDGTVTVSLSDYKPFGNFRGNGFRGRGGNYNNTNGNHNGRGNFNNNNNSTNSRGGFRGGRGANSTAH